MQMLEELTNELITKYLALSFGFTGLVLSISKEWIKEKTRYTKIFFFVIILIFVFSGILFWFLINVFLANSALISDPYIVLFVFCFIILSSSILLRITFSMNHKIHVAMTPDLGARALFNYAKDVNIIYTHRKDLVERCNENKYIESGIPIDEAKIVYRIMHWACSSPEIKEHKSYCSCKLMHQGNDYQDKIPGKDIAGKNLVLIGINDVSRDCLKKLGDNYELKYNIADNDDAFIVNNDYDKPKESTHNKEILQKHGCFYGLISRAPNPYDKKGKSTVFFISGSHRKGQEAITKWISKPENLAKIPPEINYFQLLISGNFYELHNNKYIYIHDIEDRHIIPILPKK